MSRKTQRKLEIIPVVVDEQATLSGDQTIVGLVAVAA
jgi:hypothetical protein